MASELENLPDRILHKLLYPLIKDYVYVERFVESLLSRRNDLTRKELSSVLKLAGLSRELIDIDYVAELVKNNWDVLSVPDKLQSPLVRPTLGKFNINLRVRVSRYGSEYWKLKTESYSERNCYSISEIREDDGDLQYWDGEMYDEDTYDSDTHEVEIYSVEEIIKESRRKKPLMEGVSNIIKSKSLDELFYMRSIIEEQIKLKINSSS